MIEALMTGGAVSAGVFGALAFLIYITRHNHGAETAPVVKGDADDLEVQDRRYRELFAEGLDPVWNDIFGWMATEPSIGQRVDEVERKAAIITEQDVKITVVHTTDPRSVRYVEPETQFAIGVDDEIEFATFDGRTYKMIKGKLVETTPLLHKIKVMTMDDLCAWEAGLVHDFKILADREEFTASQVTEGQRLASMIYKIREEIGRRMDATPEAFAWLRGEIGS